MAKCPNKSHPDWKSLVSQYGEYETTKMYIENGYDIPNVDGSRISKMRKVEVDHSFDNGGSTYSSKGTLDTLENNPTLAAKIIDELNRIYPNIKVSKNGLFDDNGKWLSIPPGKQGRHYRGAFTSAVAWANDSALETPPHEYAHEYIEMYMDSPIVQEAIKKFGSVERVVTLIGRKYTGQKMSNSFEKFLTKFWKQIRNTFGAPSVIDTLTDGFAKGEKLMTPMARGTEIHNFQDVQSPNYKDDSVFNDGSIKSSKITYKEEKTIVKSISSILNQMVNNNQRTTKLDMFWRQRMAGIKSDKDASRDFNNYANTDERIIKKIDEALNEDELKANVLKAINGEDIQLNGQEKFVYDTIVRLEIAYQHQLKTKNAHIEKDGRYTDNQILKDKNISEVSQTIDKRRKLLDSKNMLARELGKLINKKLRYIMNTRLWTKYLSGGENTVLSKVVYKQMNEARVPFAGFRQSVQDILGKKPTSLSDGSVFNNPDVGIEDIQTKTFELSNELNSGTQKEIILTKAEMLSVYLMNRQADKKSDLRSGIYLDEVKGREYKLDQKFILTEAQINEISAEMESDSEVVDFIARIDASMKYQYDNVNSQFKLLNGYDMADYENYFPTSHGAQDKGMSKKKNIIEDQKNLRLRLPDAGAVRLVDPFKVMATSTVSNASYFAYAVPIHNAQNIVTSMTKELNAKDDLHYIEAIQGTIDKVQDSSTLMSTQGEVDTKKFINKLQGNFTVAILAKNLGVVMKQQVSLETATNVINRKYIRKSGGSLGPVSFVNPAKLMKALVWNGVKGGETWVPIEWRQIEDNADYQTLSKHPMFRERFSGVVSKESGEALMGKEMAEDKIKMPFIKDKDGKPVYVTKSRLMQGITIMDTLTIIRLYNAVKLETQDRMSEKGFASMTEEQIEEHNIRRLQEIVDKTQPTFDQINRTGISQNSDPILRAFTMFSSASSKVGMGLTESMVDYINNPSAENRKKFLSRFVSTAVITSSMLATIDLARHAALMGLDDDDEVLEGYAWNSMQTTLGSIQGLGAISSIVISQLDSNPWYKTAQDPVLHMVQEGSEGVANLIKGNFGRSAKQFAGLYTKKTGLPFSIYNNTEKITKRFLE